MIVRLPVAVAALMRTPDLLSVPEFGDTPLIFGFRPRLAGASVRPLIPYGY